MGQFGDRSDVEDLGGRVGGVSKDQSAPASRAASIGPAPAQEERRLDAEAEAGRRVRVPPYASPRQTLERPCSMKSADSAAIRAERQRGLRALDGGHGLLSARIVGLSRSACTGHRACVRRRRPGASVLSKPASWWCRSAMRDPCGCFHVPRESRVACLTCAHRSPQSPRAFVRLRPRRAECARAARMETLRCSPMVCP